MDTWVSITPLPAFSKAGGKADRQPVHAFDFQRSNAGNRSPS
jgi:hypothetical protein